MDQAPDFGPFFAVQRIEPGAPGWRRLDELLGRDHLLAQVEATRAAVDPERTLGTSPADVRALASTMVLGLFARLLSPPIGAALTGHPAPEPRLESTWLASATSGPAPLATSAPLAAADPAATLEHVLLPVADAVHTELGVPRKVLDGNLAAAVAGACQVVELVAPDLAGPAQDLRARLIGGPLLAGSGTVSGPFVRTSCCQIYRLPMGYVCSNCVLVAAGTRMAAERSGEVRKPSQSRPRPDFTRPPFR